MNPETNKSNVPENQGNRQGRRRRNRRKPYYMNNKNSQPRDNAPTSRGVENKADAVLVDTELDDVTESYVDEDMLAPSSDDTPNVTVSIENEDDVKTVHVTGVRFKANGKVYYFDKGKLSIKDGSFVIVNTARGLEFGEVAFGDREVKESSLVLPLREIVRVATPDDVKKNQDNKKKEDEAFKICLEKIEKHDLDMKLIEAQYSFDNSKLLFYFTSASRVDFRELVKDLASVFKTRIELRQIGIRDEAKLMGGLGACGRPLCCSTFLSDFVQVSIRMAKEQNLSLNSGKISGCCGRLMCCLQYEYSTYAEETAKTPPVDSVVKTPKGIGFVTEINPLARTVKVKLKEDPDAAPETYNRDEVTLISRPQKNGND